MSKTVQVTMKKESYDYLLRGKPGCAGLKTKENVIRYLNAAWHLLGEITDIRVED